jgi:CubicO group peptidase (beta-lactamase class C family)
MTDFYQFRSCIENEFIRKEGAMMITSTLLKKLHGKRLCKPMVYFASLFIAFSFSTVSYSNSLPTAVPEDVGLSTVKLQYLDRAMQGAILQGQVAGVVTLVARHGKIAQYKAYGKMSLEPNKPMEKDALFRLYSMTKPITSVALLKLYEQGYFQLYYPVEGYIPAFKDIKVFDGLDSNGKMKLVDQKRKVSILDMFRHTSGLSYGIFSNTPIDMAYREANINYFREPLQSLIERLAKVPLLYQPGTKWHYSYSLDVLAYMVEKLSGMSYGDYLQKEIFAPLGMVDTSFGISEDKLSRYTTMYGPPGMGVLETPDKSEYLLAAKYQAGGVGLVSTTADYYRFAQMLLNKGEYNGKRVLGKKTVELLSSNHLPRELMPIMLGPMPLYGLGFGLGVSVVVDPIATASLGSVGEFGWSGYATTNVIIDPVEDMVLIYMAQFLPMNGALTEQFKTLVYQSIIN